MQHKLQLSIKDILEVPVHLDCFEHQNYHQLLSNVGKIVFILEIQIINYEQFITDISTNLTFICKELTGASCEMSFSTI